MLQCHATYHAWHGTHKLAHLPTPRGWPTRRPRRRGGWIGWAGWNGSNSFQKTAFSPVSWRAHPYMHPCVQTSQESDT